MGKNYLLETFGVCLLVAAATAMAMTGGTMVAIMTTNEVEC